MQLFPDTLLEKLGYEHLRKAVLALTPSERTRELIQGLHPTSHRETVQRLLGETAEMMAILQNPDPFPLAELPDIRPSLNAAKAERSVLPLQAFADVLLLAKTARFVKAFFKTDTFSRPRLQEYARELIPLKELEKQITAVITESGELKDNASPQLKAIRSKLNSRKNELRTTINRLMRSAVKDGMASDEGITIRNGRMVIPVLAEFKRKIKGFVHDVSATGQTVYLEPVEVLQLNNEIKQIEAEEQHEIERILRELTGKIRGNSAFLEQNAAGLAELDSIKSKARMSLQLDADIPLISPGLDMKLKMARNTSLELRNRALPKEKRTEIVPLNMELAAEEQCLVITGPNAGGKSVAMKTAGISALMVQSGFAIPADPLSEIPVFSGVFVDLGDDQSIENDLSTFSSRLQWMQNTIENVQDNALILIDEAAAGTDPEEGGALFQAFIEYLLQKPGKVLATTHHGSLKVFAHDHPGAVNGSMEFDQQNLSPTYRFKKGTPGSSYAFEIARRMNIDNTVLRRASELLGDSKNKMEALILELEQKTSQTAELKASLAKLKAQTEADKNRYKQQLESLNREKDRIKEKALIEAKAIMDTANQRIEQAVEKIALQQEADKDQIKDIRSGIRDEKKKIDRSLGKISQRKQKRSKGSKIPPKVGDYVRFLDGNTTGELVDIQGKQAVVQTDGLRLKTKYSNLIKSAAPKKKDTKARTALITGDSSLLNEAVKPALDVRGHRTESAIKEVMHYLDRAVFRGMQQVEIIHGLGDGILKAQIHSYLNERTDIKKFHTANEDHGGDGCTIVLLK